MDAFDRIDALLRWCDARDWINKNDPESGTTTKKYIYMHDGKLREIRAR